jgi:zeta-carotene desaturase
VPWYSLEDVVGALHEDHAALAALAASASRRQARPIVTVNLWFDRVVMDDRFVGLPGRTMHWIFDKRFLGGDVSHLSLVSSGATEIVALGNDDTIALAMTDVLAALPRARAATLKRATVVREKRATFSLAPGEPPRPSTRTPVPNLFLAGDWIDTGLPGTIESAVVSGHMAADAVTECGRPRS